MTTVMYSKSELLALIKKSESHSNTVDILLNTMLHASTHNIHSPKFEGFTHWKNAIHVYDTYVCVLDEGVKVMFEDLEELGDIIFSAHQILREQSK